MNAQRNNDVSRYSGPLLTPRSAQSGRATLSPLLIGLVLILSLAALVSGCGGDVAPANSTSNQPASLTAGEAAAGSADADQAAQGDLERMIIRTGNISLEVEDVEGSVNRVRDVALQVGGVVFSSNTRYQGTDLVANVTIQVPVEQFDTAISSLRAIGVRVLSSETTSQDVTEEYTDLDAQLKNLQATEAQLRTFMTQATNIDETLKVQTQLTTVRGEIEKIQGRINYLSRRADLSSIAVTLVPRPVAVTYSNEWDPGATATRSWNASVTTLTRFIDALITILIFSWWIIPLLLLGWWLWRNWRSRRPARPANALVMAGGPPIMGQPMPPQNYPPAPQFNTAPPAQASTIEQPIPPLDTRPSTAPPNNKPPAQPAKE